MQIRLADYSVNVYEKKANVADDNGDIVTVGSA
jgi:hypothetical protein